MCEQSKIMRSCLIPALVVLLMAPAGSALSQDATLGLAWVNEDGSIREQRDFTFDQVEALVPSEVTTSTPWTHGTASYTGPSLSSLAEIGSGHPIVEARLQALNDYSITVPSEDWAKYEIVLATRSDGERMRIRDHGPFWLVYPLDSHTELQSQRYHARMIWQVKSISFVVDEK